MLSRMGESGKKLPHKKERALTDTTQTVGGHICVLMTTVPTELSTQLSLKSLATNPRSVAQTVNTHCAMHKDTYRKLWKK